MLYIAFLNNLRLISFDIYYFISLFAIIGFYIINQRSRNHQALPGNDLQNQYEANQSLEIDLEDVDNPYQPTTETLLKK